MKIFKLPDLGEGLAEATIIKWHVKEGQEVGVGEILVTVESAKASVDIPASFKGKVTQLFGREGEDIKTGDALIGYEGESLLKTSENQGIVGNIEKKDVIFPHDTELKKSSWTKRNISLEAKALARKLKVDLKALPQSQEWITAEDIKKLAEAKDSSLPPLALSGARLVMASRMISSQREVLPVTSSYEVSLHNWVEKQDISARVIRAIGVACKKVPILNASFYYDTKKYRLNDSIDVGIAFDSKEGTYLPVLHDVTSMNLKEIREKIDIFKKKIENKSLSFDDCAHPTILLSNFGPLGVAYATPVIIPPMVAIVGIGKTQNRIEIIKENVTSVKILPLILTINHILINGGEASKFLLELAQDLEKQK